MYNYEIDDAIESVMDDMDEYDYDDYDDTDAFCDALESMVYDMADYLCYEKGYSEDEALEAANVYYGCALETSSQIKQVRNQARKTYNKAQKAAKRGDNYTAQQLSAQAKNLDKKVRTAKNKVDAAVNVSEHKYDKRWADYTNNKIRNNPKYKKDRHGSQAFAEFNNGSGKYYGTMNQGYSASLNRGSRGYQRMKNRSNAGSAHKVY